MSLFVCKLLRDSTQKLMTTSAFCRGFFFALPIPLLLSREVELEAESLLDGFSMILEFDKLSFLVKLEMVRNLDWTEGT